MVHSGARCGAAAAVGGACHRCKPALHLIATQPSIRPSTALRARLACAAASRTPKWHSGFYCELVAQHACSVCACCPPTSMRTAEEGERVLAAAHIPAEARRQRAGDVAGEPEARAWSDQPPLATISHRNILVTLQGVREVRREERCTSCKGFRERATSMTATEERGSGMV